MTQYILKWDTMIHLLECLKFKSLTIFRVDKEVEQLEFSYNVGINIKWHIRKTVWQFLNHYTPTGHIIHLFHSCVLIHGGGNLSKYKDLYTNVKKERNLQTTQISSERKQTNIGITRHWNMAYQWKRAVCMFNNFN